MNLTTTKSSIACVALAALAACGGSSGSPNIPATGMGAPDRTPAIRARSSVLQTIVGVGDSLTAGYQSGGFLGATNARNTLDPGKLVRPGQENGFWADIDEQASVLPVPKAIARMYDPALSPLPLIAAPGLNNQVVPTGNAAAPIGELKTGNTCTANRGFNAAGYLLGGNRRTRLDPHDDSIRDVAVPGITLHEANVLSAPQTDTCEPLPGIFGLLSAVVADESSVFWPVLGNFAGMGQNLSEVNAAASLHPTLTTVWLGANDVLKYMGSGGLFVGGDRTTAQVEQDMHQTIQTLVYAHSKVVVADLPNVLETPYFMRVTAKPTTAQCHVQTYVVCLLVNLGFSAGAAEALTSSIASSYHLATPKGCVPASTSAPCGYLTLPGALDALQYYLTAGKLPDLDCSGANFTKPCAAGSGLGGFYITPGFAGKVQALNNVVNQGIDQSARAAGVPLVPISKIFDGIASGDPSNPYFQKAASINPGVCCALVFGGGFVSFDGLHPSNTGYAFLAYYFIDAINRSFHQSIPQIDVHAAYNGTRCSIKAYCQPDIYAPPYFMP